MSTPPLSALTIQNLKNKTAWKFDLQLGPQFFPRFYCCTDPNELGIVDGKEPVAVIVASAESTVEGGTISFDSSNSYDPDGSIVAYSWSFPGGSPSTSANATEDVSFASAGEKKIRLTVTDGTGKRSVPATKTIVVVKEEDILGVANELGVSGGGVYVGTEDGIYFSADSGQTWLNVSGNLSGDALFVNDLIQGFSSYQKPQNEHILWIVNNDGVYSTQNGGGLWTKSTLPNPPNSWSDAPAPTIDDLTFHKITYANKRLFVIARWLSGGGLERSWIYYTANGIDWSVI